MECALKELKKTLSEHDILTSNETQLKAQLEVQTTILKASEDERRNLKESIAKLAEITPCEATKELMNLKILFEESKTHILARTEEIQYCKREMTLQWEESKKEMKQQWEENSRQMARQQTAYVEMDQMKELIIRNLETKKFIKSL